MFGIFKANYSCRLAKYNILKSRFDLSQLIFRNFVSFIPFQLQIHLNLKLKNLRIPSSYFYGFKIIYLDIKFSFLRTAFYILRLKITCVAYFFSDVLFKYLMIRCQNSLANNIHLHIFLVFY